MGSCQTAIYEMMAVEERMQQRVFGCTTNDRKCFAHNGADSHGSEDRQSIGAPNKFDGILKLLGHTLWIRENNNGYYCSVTGK